MFAVIRTGGKQYKVQKQDTLKIEKLEDEVGDNVQFEVLSFFDGKKFSYGADAARAKVSGKILSQERNPKITIFKKKRRQNYRRTIGHKQPVTVVEITDLKAA